MSITIGWRSVTICEFLLGGIYREVKRPGPQSGIPDPLESNSGKTKTKYITRAMGGVLSMATHSLVVKELRQNIKETLAPSGMRRQQPARRPFGTINIRHGTGVT